MKCHFVKDNFNGKITKVLIPCCYSVVMSQNISDCTCLNYWGKMIKQLKKENKKDELKELCVFLKENKIKQYG